jgi:hypothetical protein
MESRRPAHHLPGPVAGCHLMVCLRAYRGIASATSP